MLTVFNAYSEYYDLLYKDKDYLKEVEYIISLIEMYKPNAKSIIDFGCGTGAHDLLLAEKFETMTGVDFSKDMIEIAKKKNTLKANIEFIVGDIRNAKLKQKYEVAISLFHVISYQTTNEDLLNSFKTVNEHLNYDGIFIFDFWYGPGVLNDQPQNRIKKLENENIRITRFTESKLFPNVNCVDVNFEVIVEDKINKKIDRIFEIHKMRYLFNPELEFILKMAGFKIVNLFEWMKNDAPILNSWNAVIVAKKVCD